MSLSSGKAADLSKTPHLAAILARTAAKTRKAIPTKFRPSAPLTSGSTAPYEYRPSSTQSLLERLATYKLNTYANKPPAIDALAAAKCGWVNDGKDRLVCGICRASWVLAGREGMNRDAGKSKSNQTIVKRRIQAYPPSLVRSKRSRGEAAHTIGTNAQGWVPMEETAV